MGRRGVKLWSAGLAVLVLLGGGGAVLYGGRTAEVEPVDEPRLSQGAFARYVVTMEDGVALSLGDGEYLVALLSMSCDHCMASVPRLNEYVGLFPEIPVVALCWEPAEGAMAEFAAQSGPMFPMHSLGDDFLEFSELIGSAPPRLSFVRDGVAVKSWDDSMPEVEELAAAVEALRTP